MARAVIAARALKGYLLEEVVASLIKNAGYRLITDYEDDPHDLALKSNGLQVRGRGGFHQADVLGELSWAPAFGNPVRLFIEAKWRGLGLGKLGIPEVRHAVGILQDVNQVLVTVGPGIDEGVLGASVNAPLRRGRGFCYTYRYALCSTSGFTPSAQAYALAHQVALLDLSHSEYDDLRDKIELVGNDVQSYIEELESSARTQSSVTRGGLLKSIRATLRQALWLTPFEGFDRRFSSMLAPLVASTRRIGELFVGVSATGFVILLKADDPDRMVRHMGASTDPHISIHYRTRDESSNRWSIYVASEKADPCKLSFVLPDAMLRALDERQSGRRAAALDLKEQHFSRITVYRMTDTKSTICSLRLDPRWLSDARRELEERSSFGPPT